MQNQLHLTVGQQGKQQAQHQQQHQGVSSSNADGTKSNYIPYVANPASAASMHQRLATTASYTSSPRSGAQQMPQVASMGYPTSNRFQQYSGVDNLILAAMINDTASASAAAAAAAAAAASTTTTASSASNPVKTPGPPPSPSLATQCTRLLTSHDLVCLRKGHSLASQRDPNSLLQQSQQARNSLNLISAPSSKSELELYTLLEGANLLNYFGTFVSLGGDDVQQLADADEEEFLEIMNLVGMIHKPLHVRRLQKALLDWRENLSDVDCSYQSSHHHQLLDTPESVPATPIRAHNRRIENSSPRSRRSPSPHDSLSEQQIGTLLPHEVLIGAPKRLRLMDNLHQRRDETLATIGSPISNNQKAHKCNMRNETNPIDRPLAATVMEDAAPEGGASSPKQVESIDSDSERFIDVTDSNVDTF